ncbi:16S rRNA (cytosine(967)-C(5))-methyltransferase RsmB [Burkholderiaceae bacterium UC74_6]
MSSAPISPPSAPLHQLLRASADAVQAVRQGRSLTEALARTPSPVRPGAQALSFLTLRRLGAVQALLKVLVPKKPQPKIEGLLLVALVLLWPDDTPPYAEHTVVDQAVKAVKERASGGFVNAVLRRFLRERDGLVAGLAGDLVAVHNHPAWWIAQLRKDWPESWEQLLAANNEHPPMTLRPRAEANAYVQRLQDEAGIVAHLVSQGGHQAVALERAVPVDRLPGFAAGEVSVQDLAAQLAAPLLLNSGEALPQSARVLDACSAPGGKTAHLLELRPDLELLALDSDADRLVRVNDNLTRLHLRAQTRVADAREVASWHDGRPFDAILLDAPCSASGIVRRHPDARWLRRADDIARLAEIQAGLLDALWPLLKAGGRMVYATCSVFKDEGAHQIDAFLQRHGDAQAQDVAGVTGHLLPLADNGSTSAGEGPAGPSVLDGFYYALLVKSR